MHTSIVHPVVSKLGKLMYVDTVHWHIDVHIDETVEIRLFALESTWDGFATLGILQLFSRE